MGRDITSTSLSPSTAFMGGRFVGPLFIQKEVGVSSRVETLQRSGAQSLASQGADGSTQFHLIVIPDRFKGPMADIGRRIGGLSRVRSVQFDQAKSRFTIIVGSGGAEPRRIIGEVVAMGCVVRFVPGSSAIAA